MQNRSPIIDGVLKALLNKLELEKSKIKLDDGDPQYCENFAITVFSRADKADRAGRADKNTAMTFYAASIFFEVCIVACACPSIIQHFRSADADKSGLSTSQLLIVVQILNQFKGEGLENDLLEMQRYAAWKAADIRKALREGRTPAPGAPGDDPPMASTLTPSGALPIHLAVNLLPKCRASAGCRHARHFPAYAKSLRTCICTHMLAKSPCTCICVKMIVMAMIVMMHLPCRRHQYARHRARASK